MLRVAIDARLLAYQSAGTSTYIRGVLEGFRQAGSGIDLLAIVSRKGRTVESPDHLARQVAWTPCHHRFERWAFGLELAALSADVLHSPDFISPARLGRRWARVITVHDLAFLRFPDLLTEDSRRYYGQIAGSCAQAERIIAVSEATRQALLSLISPDLAPKVVVVPEGVGPEFSPGDPTLAARVVHERFGIDGPYFLFVGTIEPRKNLPRLIQAFRAFRTRAGQPAVTLVLVGSLGWLADDTKQAIASAGDAVHSLGRVESLDLISLYRGALALVLVSLDEGFGLPALEAMACGTATIVANAGALPEVVGESGIVVDPGDEDEISDAFLTIFGAPDRRNELAARGQIRSTAFSWSKVALQTADVYRQAAACVS